jgi:hypothetical protein
VRTLEVKFLSEFESIFENALIYVSGDQLSTFGEITLDKKTHTTILLSTKNVMQVYLYRNSSYIPNVGNDSGNLKVLFKQCLKQNKVGCPTGFLCYCMLK